MNHSAYEQETTTRSDKDKKKTGGTKNTTTKYNKEASNKLRKTIGIQKTPKSGENHTNVAAILRTGEIIQSNKDKEIRTKKKNKYEEEIIKLQKTPGKTEITTISTQTHAKKERKKKTTTSRTTEKNKRQEQQEQ